MKKYTTLSMVLASLLLVVTFPAFGSINIYLNPTVGDTVSFSGHGSAVFYYNGGGYYGGPFTGTLNNTTNWSTFCVEADGGEELINLGTSYTVLNLDPHIALKSNNYVSDVTKLLYWEYGHNALPATVPSWNVNDLQLAIWHGVWMGGNSNNPLIMYSNAACTVDAYLNDPAALALYGAASGLLNSSNAAVKALAQSEADSIWVLNPGIKGQSTQNQSQLYEIPEPASIIVWSLIATVSCLGVTVWRRRARG
jgi:hypothetical protein